MEYCYHVSAGALDYCFDMLEKNLKTDTSPAENRSNVACIGQFHWTYYRRCSSCRANWVRSEQCHHYYHYYIIIIIIIIIIITIIIIIFIYLFVYPNYRNLFNLQSTSL